jgi:Domain of unknown function (DUF4124)
MNAPSLARQALPSLTLVLLLMLASMSHAQTVWRCGPDGRTYADAPCPGGQVVAVADPRSPADVAAAKAVVQQDRQLARQLADDRREREREAAARGSGLAGIGWSDAVKPKAASRPTSRPLLSKQRRTADAGTSRATAPGSLQKLD